MVPEDQRDAQLSDVAEDLIMPTDLPIVRRQNEAARAARETSIAAVVIGVLPILLILVEAVAIGHSPISVSAPPTVRVANGSTCGLMDGKNYRTADPRP